MSVDLEKMFNSVFVGQIPELWTAKSLSYPSLKPLGGYFADLLKRLEYFDEWLQDKPPATFWISGFFFTQAFLTGTLQNFARKHTVPIDEVSYDHRVLDRGAVLTVKPEDGAYTYGYFLEGAGWDDEEKQLCE